MVICISTHRLIQLSFPCVVCIWIVLYIHSHLARFILNIMYDVVVLICNINFIIIDCGSLYLMINVTLLLSMHQHASTVYLSRFTKSNVPRREMVDYNQYLD